MAFDMHRKLDELGAEPLNARKNLAAMVKAIGKRYYLPADYVAFLENWPALRVSARIGSGRAALPLDRLYGGSTGAYSLPKNCDSTQHPNLLAIGGDLGGNRFVLWSRGKNRGAVGFWDHETAAGVIARYASW